MGGLEIARVTVVRSDLKPVYEQLIKPSKPIVDCNTRFSGITPEMLEDVTITLRDVQVITIYFV